MPGPIRAAISDINEAVISPVVDEGAKMIETAVQSVTGSNAKPVDPVQEARKKADEQKKLQNVHRFLNQYQADLTRHAQQKQEEQQKKMADQQEEHQEKQEKNIIESQKKEEMSQAVKNAKLTEAKQGQGVGG